MKILISLLVVAGLGLGVARFGPPCAWFDCPLSGACAEPAGSSDAVAGRCVEVRSASVFAGACHYNGEVDLQGRRALLGVLLEEGSHAGTDLSGVAFAVALDSSENLKRGAPRESVVWIDAGLEPDRREAALSWLHERHGAALGRVVAIVDADVEVEFRGEGYRVAVDDTLRVEGRLMADRACCAMPESVWYEPLLGLEGRVVGRSEVCSFSGADPIGAWSYEGRNNAFVGDLAAGPCCAPAEVERCCPAPSREPLTATP